MSTQTKSPVIAPMALDFQAFPILSTLTAEMVDQIAAIAVPLCYGNGERIFTEQDSDTALYLVARGSIRITKLNGAGMEREITIIPAGSVCGEMSLLAGMARSCSGFAVDDVVVFKIGRTPFYELLNRDSLAAHKMLLGLCEMMGARMRSMDEKIVLMQDARQDLEAEPIRHELADLREKLFNEWAF
jgi:CRP-like cAMP-binding protein